MPPPVGGVAGLDVGCGEGDNTRRLARLGARMHAADAAPTFVRHAREWSRNEADTPKIAFRVADAADLPFAAASFDFATSFMAPMDMPDRGGVLREVGRVLRPGGFLRFPSCTPASCRRIAGRCATPTAGCRRSRWASI